MQNFAWRVHKPDGDDVVVTAVLPTGALIWTACDDDRTMSLSVVGEGGAIDLLRQFDASDLGEFTQWCAANRWAMAAAALPEQRGARAAILAEVAARPGMTTHEHVDAWWQVWAEYDPGVRRNGVHVESGCTVAAPQLGTQTARAFTDCGIVRKRYENIDWSDHGDGRAQAQQKGLDPYAIP